MKVDQSSAVDIVNIVFFMNFDATAQVRVPPTSLSLSTELRVSRMQGEINHTFRYLTAVLTTVAASYGNTFSSGSL